jgi:hypothetical protein
MQLLAQDFILDAFDVQQLLYQLLDFYITSAHPDLRKSKVREIIAETDIKLLYGGVKEMNRLYALSNISKIFKDL